MIHTELHCLWAPTLLQQCTCDIQCMTEYHMDNAPLVVSCSFFYCYYLGFYSYGLFIITPFPVTSYCAYNLQTDNQSCHLEVQKCTLTGTFQVVDSRTTAQFVGDHKYDSFRPNKQATADRQRQCRWGDGFPIDPRCLRNPMTFSLTQFHGKCGPSLSRFISSSIFETLYSGRGASAE